jgi:hypothetical protein
MAILVDLNGTIATPEGKPIQHTIDFLAGVTEDIYIVSGSTVAKKPEYEDLLSRLNIKYIKLFLSEKDQQTDLEYKLAIALSIPELSLAIDNNKKVISLYRKAGINAVFPNELPQN